MVIGALKGWVGVRRGAEGGKKTWGYSRWWVAILPMQTGKGMGTTSVQCRSTDPPGEVMLASSFPSVIPPSSIKGGKKPGSSRVSFALRKILIHPRIQERATRISKRDRYWLFQAVYRRGVDWNRLFSVPVCNISGSVWIETSAATGCLLDFDIGLLTAVCDAHEWRRM